MSETLQIVNVPAVAQDSCEKSYPGKIDSQLLCAGYEEGGKNACRGDSGGPLFSNSTKGTVLHGVVSWGR